MGLLDRDYYLRHLERLEADGEKPSGSRRFAEPRKPAKCRCLLWAFLLAMAIGAGAVFAIRHYPLSVVFDAVFAIRSLGKASSP